MAVLLVQIIAPLQTQEVQGKTNCFCSTSIFHWILQHGYVVCVFILNSLVSLIHALNFADVLIDDYIHLHQFSKRSIYWKCILFCDICLLFQLPVKYLDLKATSWHWALSTHHWVYKFYQARLPSASQISIPSLQTSDSVTNANGSQINSRILNPTNKTFFILILLRLT